MKRLIRQALIGNISKNDIDMQVVSLENGKEIKVYLKNDDKALHDGNWDNAKVRNMRNTEDNFLGYVNWDVNEYDSSATGTVTVYVGEMEVREEYSGTRVTQLLLTKFKEEALDPLLQKYGEGNVYISTGFANQKLWDFVDRMIRKIGVEWAPELNEEDKNNAVTFKFRDALIENGADVHGGVVVANFPIDRYGELYQQNIERGFSYLNVCISDDATITYSPFEYDLKDMQGNGIIISHYPNDALNIPGEGIMKLIEIYKNYPQLIDNLRTTLGNNGEISCLNLIYTIDQFETFLQQLTQQKTARIDRRKNTIYR